MKFRLVLENVTITTTDGEITVWQTDDNGKPMAATMTAAEARTAAAMLLLISDAIEVTKRPPL